MARDFDLAKLLTDNGLRTTVDVDVSFDSGTLFVDADTNRVGIATTTPSYNLEVNGSLNSTSLYIGGIQVTSTATELNLLDGVTATTTEINYLDGVTSAIQTQIDNISSSFTIAADSGTNDTVTTGQTLTFAGGTGIDTTVTDNQISIAVDSTIAPLASPTFTGTLTYATLNDGTTSLTATVAELNYVDGVTSNIQTQIDNISSSFTISDNQGTPNTDTVTTGQTLTFAGSTGIDTTVSDNQVSIAIDSTVATLTGSQTLTNKTITSPTISDPTLTGTTTYATLNDGTTDLTATVAELNTLDGITATVTELNYVDGVTSNVQTQLNAKAPLASPALTGTATAVNLTISGNLTVNGTTVTNNADNLTVDDPLIELNNGATSNANDLGIVMERGTTGDNVFMGWSETTDTFVLGTTTATGASTGTISVTPGTLNIGTLQLSGTSVTATAAELNLLDGVTATTAELNYTDGVTSNIQTQLNAKLASSSYTAADVLTKIKTVDGAGSGLDADLLDGISSASFLRSDAADTMSATPAGTTSLLTLNSGSNFPLSIGTTSATGNPSLRYTQNGTEVASISFSDSDNSLNLSSSAAGANVLKVGTGATGLQYKNATVFNTVWHAGNDGAGSGLDADLLDGQQGSYYYSPANPPSVSSTFDGLTSKTSGTGTYQTSGDFRAPVFYDSNNTAYYADPNSRSIFSTLNLINGGSGMSSFAALNIGYTSGGETRAIDIDGGWSVNENKSITFTHGSSSTNIVAQINAQHNSPGSRLRWGKLYHSGDSSTYTMELISESTTSAYLTVAGSVRAPIFYDSNDTGYYLNPNALSNFDEIHTNQAWYDTNATTWGGGINLKGSSASLGFQASNQTWWYMFHQSANDLNFYRRSTTGSWNQDAIWHDGGHLEWRTGSVRAPIFYDYNNTGYYVDPNSTSNINRLVVDGRIPLMWHSRGETSTTTNRALTGSWVTHLSLGGVVVPSGYTGYILIEVNMGNNWEGGNGQYTYRVQTSGAATVTSQDHDGGWGYHNNFNPRSTKIFRMTLSTAGTYTLNLQAILTNGSVTLNQHNSTDYLGYELFIQKN